MDEASLNGHFFPPSALRLNVGKLRTPFGVRQPGGEILLSLPKLRKRAVPVEPVRFVGFRKLYRWRHDLSRLLAVALAAEGFHLRLVAEKNVTRISRSAMPATLAWTSEGMSNVTLVGWRLADGSRRCKPARCGSGVLAVLKSGRRGNA